MNSSKIAKFSESELQALKTWEAQEDFGLSRSETVEVVEAPRTLTVEEIEAMQKQAYAEAFQQGRVQGFEHGTLEGFEEGKRQGYEIGRVQGYQESLHLLQKQVADMMLLMEAFSEPFQKLDESVEEELVKLAITIAGQVIRREIKQDPGEIIAVIREAVKVLPSASQKITLTLHPEDAVLLRSTLKLDDSLPAWRLLENPLLSRGGCTVETETSRIDATLEHRLAAVVASVFGDERQQDLF